MKPTLLQTVAMVSLFAAGLSAAYAAVPVSLEFLENPIAREALQTQAGVRLLTEAGLPATEELPAFLGRPESREFQAQLQAGLGRIENDLQKYRGLRRRGGPGSVSPAAAAELSADERALVRALSAKHLNFAPSKVDFLPLRTEALGASVTGAASERAAFLRGGAGATFEAEAAAFEARVTEASGPTAATAEALLAESQVAAAEQRGFLTRMHECVASLPPSAAKSSRNQAMLQGLGVSEFFTVGADLAASWQGGLANVPLKEVSTDAIMTAVSTVAGTYLLSGSKNFRVRWMKGTVFNEGMNVVDAAIYEFVPTPQPKDGAPRVAPPTVAQRWMFNSAYTMGTSFLGPSLYEITTGLSCLYPASKWVKAGNLGLRMAVSAGNNLLYVVVRKHAIE